MIHIECYYVSTYFLFVSSVGEVIYVYCLGGMTGTGNRRKLFWYSAAMKNKYIHRSKITEAKFRQLVKLFAMDLTATQTAELTHLNRNTVNRLYRAMRERISEFCRQASPVTGEFVIDQSCFCSDRVKGKRGRAASGKTIVFGLFMIEGNVHTEIIPDVMTAAFQDLIRGKIDINSVIRADTWRGYDGLVDIGYDKYFRVNRVNNEFSKGNRIPINGIESFWGYTKHRLAKFNGIPKPLFETYLKETEFRFNHRGQDLYLALLKLLRERPLF